MPLPPIIPVPRTTVPPITEEVGLDYTETIPSGYGEWVTIPIPEVTNVLELTNFSFTVTFEEELEPTPDPLAPPVDPLAPPDPDAPPTFVREKWIKSAIPVHDSKVKATFFHNILTVTGYINDRFYRELTYYDKFDNVQVAHTFNDMPTEFNSLFKYVGAAEGFLSEFVTVTFLDHTVYDYEYIVHTDYTAANQNLVNEVAKGYF